jgi:hypothetical protein
MANVSAIKKTIHVVTADEANAGIAAVRILWDAPFYDTNYVISFTLEVGDADIANSGMLCVTDVTPAGFTAQVYVSSILPGPVTIHAMASHK